MPAFAPRHLIAFVCGLTLIGTQLSAQSRYWFPTNGPYGGSIMDIAQLASGELVVATLNGLFISDDSGTTWSPFASPLPERGTTRIASTPDGSILVASDQGSLFRSSDNGISWAKLQSFKGRVSTFTTGRQYVFMGMIEDANLGSGRLYRSTDNGSTWSNKSEGLWPFPSITSLACDTVNGILYAGTFRGLFKSTDFGDRWTKLSGGLDTTGTNYTVAVTPDGANVFAGSTTPGKVYRSTNLGLSWTPTGPTGDPRIKHVAVSPTGTVIALSGDTLGSVYRSTNKGGTWLQTTLTNTGPYYAIKFPATLFSGELCFIGTNDGLKRSTDAGATWSQADQGLQNVWITDLYRLNDYELFATSFLSGVHRTSDSGQLWERRNGGFFFYDYRSIVRTRRGTMFIRDPNGRTYKSTNDGQSWDYVQVGLQEWGEGLAMFVSDSDHVFLGGYGTAMVGGKQVTGYGIFRSSDDGATWSVSMDSLGTRVIYTFAQKDSVTLFAGGFNRLFRSRDHGQNWEYVPIPGNVWKFEYDRDARRLFSGTTNGLFISDDDGNTWNALTSEGKNGPWGLVSRGDFIMLSNETAGCMASYDGGTTWWDVSLGLDGRRITTLVLNDDATLYAGTTGGVYKKLGDLLQIPPHRLFPNDTLTRSPFSIVMSWQPSRNADTYHVQIAEHPQFTGILVDTAVSAIASFAPTLPNVSSDLYWRVRCTGNDASGAWSAVARFRTGTVNDAFDGVSIPHRLSLGQNYPNPCNKQTVIPFVAQPDDAVSLLLFDRLGRHVRTLNIGRVNGQTTVTLDTDNLATGVYFYMLKSGLGTVVRAMQIVR